MKSLKIVQTFKTLAEAVNASDLDLSYNPEIANRRIKDHDRGCRYYSATEKAFLMENGEVYSVYTSFDGIRIVSKFEPFHSCMSDCPFVLCFHNEQNGELVLSDVNYPKTQRAAIAKTCAQVPALCVM